MIELIYTFDDREAMRAAATQQFAKRRAFLPFIEGVVPRTPCILVLTFEGAAHNLPGEVVYVKEDEPGRGVGLQLAPLDDSALAALLVFVDTAGAAPAEPEAPAAIELPELPLLPELPVLPDLPEAPAPEPAATEAAAAEHAPDAAAAPPAEPAPEVDEGHDPKGHALRLDERMRKLSSADQRKYALTGNLAERTVLERMYGPLVWETLINSGRLTVPEVATIARKGTVPKPLIEAIGANAGWLASGEVQRALLSNPRSSPAVVNRVLRALSRADLALVPQQSAYSAAVRQAAKALLSG